MPAAPWIIPGATACDTKQLRRFSYGAGAPGALKVDSQ
jgi:hypothetical protein